MFHTSRRSIIIRSPTIAHSDICSPSYFETSLSKFHTTFAQKMIAHTPIAHKTIAQATFAHCDICSPTIAQCDKCSHDICSPDFCSLRYFLTAIFSRSIFFYRASKQSTYFFLQITRHHKKMLCIIKIF